MGFFSIILINFEITRLHPFHLRLETNLISVCVLQIEKRRFVVLSSVDELLLIIDGPIHFTVLSRNITWHLSCEAKAVCSAQIYLSLTRKNLVGHFKVEMFVVEISR